MTAAIVLAGGRSRRFGADKLAARLRDGRSVLAHATAAAAAVAEELVVVLSPGAARPDGLPDGIRIVHDPDPDGGPLMGLATGLAAIDDAIVVVVGGDMPALDIPVLRLLIEAVRRDTSIQAARLELDGSSAPGADAGPSGAAVLPCVLRCDAARRACRTAMAAGDRRLRGSLEPLATMVVPAREWRALDPAGRTLLDIDRPGDLAALDDPG